MNLYICDRRTIDNGSGYESLIDAFAPEVSDRIRRRKREEDRVLAVMREVLLQSVLKERFGDPDIPISHNEYGKPFVKGAEGFFFNLSHAGDLVGIAFGDEPVGLDVERCGRVKDYEKLLHFFPESDREYIRSARDPEYAFLTVWTYREALSKEEGTGLTLFEKAQVSFDYGMKQAFIGDSVYYFYGYEYPDHMITLCMESQGKTPSIRRIFASDWQEMTEEILKKFHFFCNEIHFDPSNR